MMLIRQIICKPLAGKFPSHFFLILLLASLAPTSQAELMREWVDSTGQRTIQAEFVRVDGAKVVLRKFDGKEVSVPLAHLSGADRRYAESRRDVPQGATEADRKEETKPRSLVGENAIATFRVLQRSFSKKYRGAENVLQVVTKFADDKSLASTERQLAREAIPKWTDRARQGLVRYGREWITPVEIDRIRADEILLLRKAHRLMEVDNDRLALDRFHDASKVNREGIRADFYLGLLNVLVAQHPLTAVKHFDECVDRLNASPDRLVGARRANLVAALNNLAVAQVRTKKYDRAIRNWERAIEISPQTPELVQNLGLLTQLSGARISRRVGDKAGDLYAEATVANSSAEFDNGVGWLYIPLIDNLDGTMSEGGDNELRSVSWATGVAVAPDLVLTTTFATADADKYQINGKFAGIGKIVAIAPETNLVLIRFEGLDAKPITWSEQPPARASSLNLVGFSQPGNGAIGLRTFEATVLDIRRYDPHEIATILSHVQTDPNGGVATIRLRNKQTIGIDRMLIHHDVVADAGLIGSPLCDSRGRAYAIHLGSHSNQARSGADSSLAETSDSILAFVSSALTGVESDTSFAQPGALTEPMGGLTEDFSRTIFQVTGLKIAPRLQWSHRIASLHRSHQEGGWTSFEDRSCMGCNGTGDRECPNRKCKRGKIKSYTTKTITNPDGSSYSERVPVYNSCRTCGGKGRVSCQSCGSSGNK